MTDVQARPAELSTFATNGRTIHTTLQTARTDNRPAFVAFRNAPGGGAAAQGDAIVNQAMTDLLSELDEIPKWVKLVHDALVAADVTDANGEVRITPQELTQRMVALVGQEQFEALELTPDHGSAAGGRHGAAGLRLRQRPVCTATGTCWSMPTTCDAGPARCVVVPADLRITIFARWRIWSRLVELGRVSWIDCGRWNVRICGSGWPGIASSCRGGRAVHPPARARHRRRVARRLDGASPLGPPVAQPQPDVDVRRRPTRGGHGRVRRHGALRVGPPRPPRVDDARQRTHPDVPVEGQSHRRDRVRPTVAMPDSPTTRRATSSGSTTPDRPSATSSTSTAGSCGSPTPTASRRSR